MQLEEELFLGSLLAETIFFSLFRTLFRPKCHLLVPENLHSLMAFSLSYFIFNLISYLWAKPGPDHNGRLTRRGNSDVYLCCRVSGIVISFEVLDTTGYCWGGHESQKKKKGLTCRNRHEVKTTIFLFVAHIPSCMNVCIELHSRELILPLS